MKQPNKGKKKKRTQSTPSASTQKKIKDYSKGNEYTKRASSSLNSKRAVQGKKKGKYGTTGTTLDGKDWNGYVRTADGKLKRVMK